VRAAVEAMAYQTRDVVETMAREAGVALAELRVDGGASVMDLLCQLQADQLGVEVRRPVVADTTALGAAFLAGLGEGVWASTADLASAWRLDRAFTPRPDREERDRLHAGWLRAVERARHWVE
jgi:glycerol kinase